jgi:hypothetical protein
MSDGTRQQAALEISAELQAIFGMIAGGPSEDDGWYSTNRLYELAQASGSQAGSLSRDAFRFRIRQQHEAGRLEKMTYGSKCFYRIVES